MAIFRDGWGGDPPPKNAICRGGSSPHPPLQIIFKFMSEVHLIQINTKTCKKSEIFTISLLWPIELEKD